MTSGPVPHRGTGLVLLAMRIRGWDLVLSFGARNGVINDPKYPEITMTTSKIVSQRGGVALAAVAWLLTGCGLAETTAVAATEAEAAAQQIKDGKAMEEKIQRDLEAANKAAAEARARAE